ncbi:PKD domain-containing protein [Methanococcoides sp. SA1]|nr:PKD domain-containing protein [Methanococcoides sp. SA1]
MNSLIKPLGFLLLITILLSGLTTITNDPPELPQNPGNDSHENNLTKWSDQPPSKDDGSPQIRVTSGSYIPKVLVVPMEPVSNFTANITSGDVPLSVKFSDMSSGATSWAWDVDGDGIMDSNDTMFVHIYTTPGTYDVSLTATNPNGSDTKIITGYITAYLPETEPVMPVANFTSNVTVGLTPLSVKFTDLSLDAANVSWDVNGDGIENSNMSEFVYVYNLAGTYNVSIIATNPNGSDTKKVVDHITVSDPEVGPSVSLEKFTNGHDADEGPGPIVTVGSEINWSYVITNTGTVCLTSITVTDDMEGFIGSISALAVGESQTLFKIGTATEGQYSNIGYVQTGSDLNDEVMSINRALVDVGGGAVDSDPSHYYGVSPEALLPTADFTLNVSSGAVPFSVKFTDISQNATTVSWDVNEDGIEDSNASEFVYVYGVPGTYNVSLTATNPNGTDVKFDLVNAYLPEEVPEFPTIALPVLVVIGLMFILQRRK